MRIVTCSRVSGYLSSMSHSIQRLVVWHFLTPKIASNMEEKTQTSLIGSGDLRVVSFISLILTNSWKLLVGRNWLSLGTLLPATTWSLLFAFCPRSVLSAHIVSFLVYYVIWTLPIIWNPVSNAGMIMDTSHCILNNMQSFQKMGDFDSSSCMCLF